MAEYIDREKLPPKKERGFFLEDDFNAGWNACLNKVNSIPAADVVERKTGKWIGYPECLKFTNAYSDDHIVCSACEECFSILDNDCERFNFCPNCGAKMIGGDDDV